MAHEHHLCGVAHTKWLDNSIRRAIHNPFRLFGSYITPGGCALDVGCGSGTFTASLAKLVGTAGKVVAIDVQHEMLALTKRNVERSGVSDRVTLHQCSESSLNIDVTADFILTFYMIHESPHPLHLVDELAERLKAGGYWFLAEPIFHVTKKSYREVIDRCRGKGLTVVKQTGVFSRIAVLTK